MPFFQRLSDKIKNKLATNDYRVSLKMLEDQATHIDLLLLERRRERGGRAERETHLWGESKHLALNNISFCFHTPTDRGADADQ